MAIKLLTTIRNNMATQIVNAIDAGSGPGLVKIYDGSQPAGPHVAVTTQNILSEHTLSDPCGSVASGALTFSSITDDNYANASGTATWARFFDSDNNAIADASITVTGGGGDLQMNTTTVVINGPIRFSSLVWTMPGG